jgi:hypothetical protein
MAAQDLSPALVDQRMTEWALLAHRSASWDQVANLLGVKPAYDAGMPVQLALNRSATPEPVEVAAASVAPEPEPAPEPAIEVAQVSAPDAAPVFELPVAETPRPAFAAALGIEPEPVAPKAEPVLIRAEPAPIKQAVVPAFRPAAAPVAKPVRVSSSSETSTESGRFVVQLGAFSTEARAKVAWKQAYGKTRELGDYSVGTPRVQVRNASLYRLAVSGFSTQSAANQVCRKVKAAGGECFVRSVSNSAPIQWANRGGTRIASRR